MIVLDENITRDQRELLLAWGAHVRQIGVDVGRSGLLDSDIIPLLLKQRDCTFFTRDADFCEARLCHEKYCIVCLGVERNETAFFVRRFLRHPLFNTRRKRMGAVVLVTHPRVEVWRTGSRAMRRVGWDEA